jgi:chromodomain-helicase-DNA-binding protein 1
VAHFLGHRIRKRQRLRDSVDEDDHDAMAIRFSTRQKTNVSYADPQYLDMLSGSDSEGERQTANQSYSGPYEHQFDPDAEPVIEMILDHRSVSVTGEDGQVDDAAPPTTEILVKWKGKSHLYNTWHTEEDLKHMRGYKKVQNYLKLVPHMESKALGEDDDEQEERDIEREMKRGLLEEYKQVERVLAVREGVASLENPSGAEYLCKWKRLEYRECTWEPASIITEKFQAEIDMYYAREHANFLPYKGKVYSGTVMGSEANRPRWMSREQPSYVTNGQLREYQLLGVSWMLYLWSRNENGILADEMGLGKTVQTITTFNVLMHEHRVHGPFLVVVPLSVIHSWASEFAKWAPELNVVVYIGSRESRAIAREYDIYSDSKSSKKKIKCNVVLTTFELILKDQAELKSIRWAYLAVDEAHRLKNAGSQLHEALKDFNTANRLLITGTPLQNTIRELNALIQFLMPHKFADLEEFEFDPAQEGNEERIRVLHERLKPYMLRRLKKDVEKSLPNKSERILRVDLAPLQVHYYKNILTRNFQALNKGAPQGAQLSLLNVVAELKKASNHPFLFPNAEEEALGGSGAVASASHSEALKALLMNSGKLLLLDKLLNRLKSGGHRVLIFSQMVRILDILTDYLNLRNYKFQRLDGSVNAEQRKKAVEHFNAPESPDFVFLLSTRAGGLGLNLTTADTVIIFDSDWNPQNDLQAMARAHRIGQTKQVNVYRLVSKGTIEEEIIERAKRKMILEYCIIKQMDTSGRHVLLNSKGGGAPMKLPSDKMSREELSAILKFGAQSMFNRSTEEENKLDDVDLDDILARAEEREQKEKKVLEELEATAETLADPSDNSAGEFLQQFQVTEFAFDQLTWEDIIPEVERKAAEEKERERVEMEFRKQEEAMLLRKYKKTLGVVAGGAPEELNNSKDAAKRRRAVGNNAGRSGKLSQLSNANEDFSEKEIRGLSRALCRFGDLNVRRSAILSDASLESKSSSAVDKLYDEMITECERAVVDASHTPSMGRPTSRAVTTEFRGVPINASQILSRIRELSTLFPVITGKLGTKGEPTPTQILGFRITHPMKPVTNWSVPWSPKEDSLLIVGVFRHGFGNWMKIKEDASLGLSSKLFLGDDEKDYLPRQEHLSRRAEYVIKVLNDKYHVKSARSLLSNSGGPKRRGNSRGGSSRALNSSGAAEDATEADESDLSDLDSPSEEASRATIRKRKGTSKKDKPAKFTSRQKKSKLSTTSLKKEVKEKKPKKDPEEKIFITLKTSKIKGSTTLSSSKSKELPAFPVASSAVTDHESDTNKRTSNTSLEARVVHSSRSGKANNYSDEDSDIDYDLDACKARMKAVKHSLRRLRDTPDIQDQAEKVATTSECMRIIGDQVTRQELEMHTDLWKYVAEWFPNRPKWAVMRALYNKIVDKDRATQGGGTISSPPSGGASALSEVTTPSAGSGGATPITASSETLPFIPKDRVFGDLPRRASGHDDAPPFASLERRDWDRSISTERYDRARPREGAREFQREFSREFQREAPRETSRDSPRDRDPFARSRSREQRDWEWQVSKEGVRDRSYRDRSIDRPWRRTVELPQVNREQTRDQGRDQGRERDYERYYSHHSATGVYDNGYNEQVDRDRDRHRSVNASLHHPLPQTPTHTPYPPLHSHQPPAPHSHPHQPFFNHSQHYPSQSQQSQSSSHQIQSFSSRQGQQGHYAPHSRGRYNDDVGDDSFRMNGNQSTRNYPPPNTYPPRRDRI